MKNLRVAIAQITSTEEQAHNTQQILECLERAEVHGSLDLICFPENSLFLRVQKSSTIRYSSLNGLAESELQKKVETLSFPILITLPLKEGDVEVNATVLLRAGQLPKILYRKIHLFDVDVPGAPPVRESDRFVGGDNPLILKLGDWRIGLTICYDLRFAELFLQYAKAGVDAVLVPSAFLAPTGEAHWNVLLRARAIEGQFYVLAPAQSGEHRMGDQVRQTYGHSLAVDPWGRVLVELTGSPEIAVVELRRDEITKVRNQIPMHRHRRNLLNCKSEDL